MVGGAGGPSAERLAEPLPDAYAEALAAMDRSDCFSLWVAELAGDVVGTSQLSLLLNLSHVGRPVAQVESVHVAQRHRSQGIGEAMMRHAISQARARGCFRLQLTSNRLRTDAHHFYRRLGFVDSHVGMKLALD
jgi:GNAT superfamily N-acetyltransferase